MNDTYELFLYEKIERGGSACSGVKHEDHCLEVQLGSTDFVGPKRVNEAIVKLKEYRIEIHGIGDFFDDVRTFLKDDACDMIYDLALSAMMQAFFEAPAKFGEYIQFVVCSATAEGYNARSGEVRDTFHQLMGRTSVTTEAMHRRIMERAGACEEADFDEVYEKFRAATHWSRQ